LSDIPYTDGLEHHSPTNGEGIAAVEASIGEVSPAEATERATRTSLWNYPATYTLIGMNLAVYAVMFGYGPIPGLLHSHVWTGVLTAPFDISVLARFGATSSELIQQGDWWRLITGTFVHVTLLHILLNMWCLWNLGLFGEPLLGKRGLVSVYLLTGTAGMMLSYTLSVLSGEPGIVAGASGSVFGIAGILIVLLSNRSLSVPWDELRKLRQQVIFFAAINLVLGIAPRVVAIGSSQFSSMMPRIDNSAHLGGFLSGLALGLPLFPKMTSGRESYRRRQRIAYAVAALLLCLFAYALTRFVKAQG
jgi:rhomboid protease GluP